MRCKQIRVKRNTPRICKVGSLGNIFTRVEIFLNKVSPPIFLFEFVMKPPPIAHRFFWKLRLSEFGESEIAVELRSSWLIKLSMKAFLESPSGATCSANFLLSSLGILTDTNSFFWLYIRIHLAN